jgi:hypothetical protein
MNTLILTLLSLSALIVFYGMIKIFILAREYNDRRSVFDHRIDGRKTEKRNENRRTNAGNEACSSV